MNDPQAECNCCSPDLRHLGYRRRWGGWKFLASYYCLNCGAIWKVKEYVKVLAE